MNAGLPGNMSPLQILSEKAGSGLPLSDPRDGCIQLLVAHGADPFRVDRPWNIPELPINAGHWLLAQLNSHTCVCVGIVVRADLLTLLAVAWPAG